MWIGHILGWINTRILLGIVFYALVTPIGIVFRLMGKDTMRQAFAETSTTYQGGPISKTPFPYEIPILTVLVNRRCAWVIL